MLNTEQVIEQARILKGFHMAESEPLDTIRRYWKGRQLLPAVIPSSAPREVRTMARIARVNVCSIVVDTLAQSTFVDGFRSKQDSEDADVWAAWQANRFDARQTGIHRAAFAYGAAYCVVLPGDRGPVMRGVSPRAMTVLYGEDPDWPMWALEKVDNNLWRIYDDEAIYYVGEGSDGAFTPFETREHGAGVTPVVRYLDEEDLDADDDVEPAGSDRDRYGADVPMRGQVAPLIPIQDQIDLTTFGLLVAQWYAAFRQRWAIGWVAEDETEKMKASASQLWTFDENPEDMKLGEFEQTNLDGYIKSREASLRHAATLSQTPVHELIGELVNLSAEALTAAEAGRDRKVDERQTLLGEAHEQTMWLVGRLAGYDVPDDAQVVWRDTSARAFSATVDALGKLTAMLGIPPQELWERVPGATRQDVAALEGRGGDRRLVPGARRHARTTGWRQRHRARAGLMARTPEGAALTEAHREAQLRVRAQALRQYMLVWPLWHGDGASFDRLLEVTAVLVLANRALSASLAAGYYQAFRAIERAPGAATPRLAPTPTDEALRGTLHLTGWEARQKALAAGQSPQQAMKTALVRTSGTVTRFVLDGGRDTLVQSSGEDKKAGGGWARVTAGEPCAFCALLSARGPVYSADTADFEAHDHCACVPEPHYPGADWPGRGWEFKQMYDRAIREAKASGDLKRGTANDALNAFRRHLSRQ